VRTVLAVDRTRINILSMSATKQTGRGKGRKRTAPSQEASAPAYGRKRTGRRRKASASDVPDIRTWSGQVELPPPRAPQPKTVLQSKLDTLIGLLAETQPAASAGIPPHVADAANSQSVSPTPHALHKEMLWRIASLEAAMARLPSRPQDLDDDSPREPIKPASFSEIDRQAVADSIALLKTQPPEPTEPPVEALEAAQILRAVGTQRWNAASSGQADTFLSAAVKSAGSPFWLADRICALADAAINWINSLKSAF
jgi:hypothetical protein